MHDSDDNGVDEPRHNDRGHQDDERYGPWRRKGERMAERAQLRLDVLGQVLPHVAKL
jgi:hypothetical protein